MAEFRLDCLNKISEINYSSIVSQQLGGRYVQHLRHFE